jgi:hypothetical protein
MNNTLLKSTIRLFKAVPIKGGKGKIVFDLFHQTIKDGYIFSPAVIYNYGDCQNLIQIVEELYGVGGEKLNATFHKSWAKVRDTEHEQLIVEQLAHYATTYGKESPAEYLKEKGIQWGVDNLAGKIIELGDFESDKIWDEDYVYFPKEELRIPFLDVDNVRLVIIKGYTKEQLKEKVMNLLRSGVALARETIEDILNIVDYVKFTDADVEEVKNKEVRAALYDGLNLVPRHPTEFLRYAIYKLTGETLLIKNRALITKIKETSNETGYDLFYKYTTRYGAKRLAEIFYRFKPIFLAFRTHNQMRWMVNRIRRLAETYHKPMPEDYLNNVTAKIKQGHLSVYELDGALRKANTFRKIRLAYALKYRTNEDIDSILYRVRNGRGYATDFTFQHKKEAEAVLDCVVKSIAMDVAQNVSGKKIYLPDDIHYTLPATEKQFTGNFPSGTYVEVPSDMVFGVNWKNLKGHRIDLDMSTIDAREGKIGWDSRHRDSRGSVLFSGDITDARGKRGATEAFYIQTQRKNALILFCNFYNFREGLDVPIQIFVAREENPNMNKNYMINPNNLVMSVASNVNQKSKILGLVVVDAQGSKFYFAESYVGASITSRSSDFVSRSRDYLFDFYENTIMLKDILEKAGAIFVEDKDECDIDLSPEALEKDTILNLLIKQ